MKSIKEKAEELSIAFRKEQGDVGYSEQLSYKLGIEAGANYVLNEIEKQLDEFTNYEDSLIVSRIIEQLKK